MRIATTRGMCGSTTSCLGRYISRKCDCSSVLLIGQYNYWECTIFQGTFPWGVWRRGCRTKEGGPLGRSPPCSSAGRPSTRARFRAPNFLYSGDIGLARLAVRRREPCERIEWPRQQPSEPQQQHFRGVPCGLGATSGQVDHKEPWSSGVV
jgi:hypothetical protein